VIAIALAVLPTSSPVDDALAATSTTTHPTTTSTTIPVPDCEALVASSLGQLAVRVAACDRRAAQRGLKGKPFDDPSCEARARTAYDRAVRRVDVDGCPTCVVPVRGALADATRALSDAVDGDVYCAPGPPLSPQHPGNAPTDRRTLNCENRMQAQAQALVRRLLACTIDGVQKGGTAASIATCGTIARKIYDKKVARLACSPCLDTAAVANDVQTALVATLPQVFCSCVHQPASFCDDRNTCTTDSCDPIKGCTHANAADGGNCAQGSTCTLTPPILFTQGVCHQGQCVPQGTVTNCNDGNFCTDDGCDPATGCTHTNNTAPCANGNACVTDDVCSNGQCVGGVPVNCDDGDPCTLDSCSQSAGCIHTPIHTMGCP